MRRDNWPTWHVTGCTTAHELCVPKSDGGDLPCNDVHGVEYGQSDHESVEVPLSSEAGEDEDGRGVADKTEKARYGDLEGGFLDIQSLMDI